MALLGCGGEPARFRVRPDGSVVLPAGDQHGPCLRNGRKKRLLEAFIAQLAFEAFEERILGRLARRDVMPFKLPLLRPA